MGDYILNYLKRDQKQRMDTILCAYGLSIGYSMTTAKTIGKSLIDNIIYDNSLKKHSIFSCLTVL